MVNTHHTTNPNSGCSGKVRIEKELLATLPKMYREVAQYLIDNHEWMLVDGEAGVTL